MEAQVKRPIREGNSKVCHQNEWRGLDIAANQVASFRKAHRIHPVKHSIQLTGCRMDAVFRHQVLARQSTSFPGGVSGRALLLGAPVR
jgi:hypothetical protein